ncbi:PREDICTED: uncharacterized protein LOC105152930 [Acromyrmex echinatior]|uniref:uncharacterized protein LOC105152930 n=1 Tax=Acromyrmex echinatior TaxID=103372 RepID=UPI000580D9A3|nr:PREDICTED: uncharacterized protein LOC105152930 [Acromyrmex echinatior]XP_011065780.1 PREDICTED: uncharacterized protein LOC105152930 [Acromyrmex echinatior]
MGQYMEQMSRRDAMTPVSRNSANVDPIFWVKELNLFDLGLDLVRSQAFKGKTMREFCRTVIRRLRSSFADANHSRDLKPKKRIVASVGRNTTNERGVIFHIKRSTSPSPCQGMSDFPHETSFSPLLLPPVKRW